MCKYTITIERYKRLRPPMRKPWYWPRIVMQSEVVHSDNIDELYTMKEHIERTEQTFGKRWLNIQIKENVEQS